MNIFTPYTDNPLTQERLQPIEFETTDELLQLEIMQQHAKSENFNHFALSLDCLYLVQDDGFRWKLIGLIKHPNTIQLPKFEGWKYKAILNGKEIIVSKEIKCINGNEITLNDGTIVTKLET